ncbi:type II/IV secretion system protein [Candidatus Peregrinibacteria bacterium]|mgnify:CR=1 FL=1|nr:type II/IV secretion system protein [Candidatus Peregrinibacteria bacterium]MBT7736504.1 type II/IV secretion system protein [Candidatus Peregrinibacteria bacterium]
MADNSLTSDQGGTANSGAATAPAADSANPQAVQTQSLNPANQTASNDPVKQVDSINRDFQEKATMRVAKEKKLPYIHLSKTPLNPDFLKILDAQTSKSARTVVFFKSGQNLRVATENPDTPESKAAVAALLEHGYKVEINMASSAGMEDALKIYDSAQQYKKIENIETVEQKTIKTYEKEIADLSELPKQLEGSTAQEALNLLDVAAMKTKASDLHYEPSESNITVRMRIDGVLHKVFDLKPSLYSQISEQIKYQSKMRLNVSLVPQDGRYLFNFNENKVGVRVSSIPTPNGESFVCRYLPSDKKVLTLEELGFQGLALTKLQKAANISQGMILITGPTGSGKSTTLFSMLGLMNSPENKVITLEDPVEYYIDGVTQSQISEKDGYDFSGGLRSILRQDPDIVMLGEIRDLKTAETAAQASLTGHVLLSTLHTNSALEAIPRLINMGLPAFVAAPSLNTIVAQRLVRKVCPSCSLKEPINDSAKKEFETVLNNLKAVNSGIDTEVPVEIPKIVGCDKCSNTGYLGRIVIDEVITISSEMKRLILNNKSSVDLIAAARKEGITTMREDGYLKVAQGLTTLEEVYRVTNVLS